MQWIIHDWFVNFAPLGGKVTLDSEWDSWNWCDNDDSHDDGHDDDDDDVDVVAANDDVNVVFVVDDDDDVVDNLDEWGV